MHRRAVGGGGATFLLVFGILLGAGGYYLFFVNLNGTPAATTTVQVATTTTVQGVPSTVTQSVTMTSTRTLSLTETLTEVVTATSTQSSSSTTSSSTSTYQVPSNVTLAFTNVSGEYLYVVQAGNSVTSAKEFGDYSLQIDGLSKGEMVTITGTTQGPGGCTAGEHFTMVLWVDGQAVSQAYGYCSGGSASITYTV